MSKTKIVLNKSGVRELMQSAEMMSICDQHAAKAMSRLGDGYEKETRTGKSRVNVKISAKTKEAVQDNLDNNSLIKAVYSS